MIKDDVQEARHKLNFGISLPPVADAGAELRGLARLADEAGLDLLGIQDHPYVPRFLDTMSLISVLLADTERLRMLPNVASLPLRPPAMLAKAASLDVLSGGRFELGIGSGAVWPAIHAMGGPRRSIPEAVEALEEAIAVIRACGAAHRPPGSAASTTSGRELPWGPGGDSP